MAVLQRWHKAKGRVRGCVHCRRFPSNAGQFKRQRELLLDTGLKVRFWSELQARSMTLGQAAKAIRIPYPSLYDWLRRPKGFLSSGSLSQRRHLKRMTRFLGISYKEAVRLQGGTDRDHYRQPVEAIAWWNARGNHARAQKAEAIAKGNIRRVGRSLHPPHPQKVKDKIGAAHRGKRRNFTPTREYRVRLLLANLQRKDPKATLDQISAIAITRMMTWPDGFNRPGAAGLVANVVLRLRGEKAGGRTPGVDWDEVHRRLLLTGAERQTEQRIARDLDVSVHTIRTGYRRWLDAGGHLTIL
jgi:hypothetical protein